MPKLRIEWEAGYREFEIGHEEFEEWAEQGRDDMYFDPYISDTQLDIELYTEVSE